LIACQYIFQDLRLAAMSAMPRLHLFFPARAGGSQSRLHPFLPRVRADGSGNHQRTFTEGRIKSNPAVSVTATTILDFILPAGSFRTQVRHNCLNKPSTFSIPLIVWSSGPHVQILANTRLCHCTMPVPYSLAKFQASCPYAPECSFSGARLKSGLLLITAYAPMSSALSKVVDISLTSRSLPAFPRGRLARLRWHH
jgi:hypothetical protein